MLPESRTRNEAVFNRIREDILSGILVPGSRLRFADMCARYGTSVGVVREALSRISEQGLAQLEPQLGYRVVPISAKDLRELTDARCDIEGLTLRYSVMQGDIAWEGNVVAIHHRMMRTPTHLGDEARTFNEEWGAVHKQFHTVLLDGCRNERLKSIALSLRDAAEVYRRAGQRPSSQTTKRDVEAEHRTLMEAAVSRDADAAVAALVHHIRATTEYLLQLKGAFGAENAESPEVSSVG